MSNPLLELFQACLNKNFEFSIKIIEDKKNELIVNWEEKIVTVHIGDPNCQNLQKELIDLVDKLQ